MGFRATEVTLRSLVASSVAIAVALMASSASAADLDWDPEHTHVFVVGLLEWEREDIWSPFPEAKKDRCDEQLVQYFLDAGVPAERVKYLQDAKATKQHVIQAFNKFLDNTEEGDFLVFYFAGHGYRDRDTGQTWFAIYDAADKNQSGWNVRGIFKAIEERFSGDRALLLADCCHSGALYDEVLARADSEIAYATLTSSYSHNTSTGAWTFTDSLLEAMRGRPVVDYNEDQTIDLAEAARFVRGEMAFIEGQMSMFIADEDFGEDTVVAEPSGPREPHVDSHCQAQWNGKWFKARVVEFDAASKSYKVHYLGYNDDTDEWLPAARIRPYKPQEFAVGAKVQGFSSDDDKWYPAKVRDAWYGLHLIRYDGYDAAWDEWVGPGFVKARGAE